MKKPKSYPLTWPDNWPRTKYPEMSAFKTNSYNNSYPFEIVETELLAELRRLGAQEVTVSCNLPLHAREYRDAVRPRDTGVAVWFVLMGKRTVLACDKWERVECNVWAITKHIEALRGQQRWGIGSVEQAFTGYFQLPAPMVLKPWYVVLEVEEDCDFAEAQANYRRLAKKHHPDNGGSTERMAELNAAWDTAKDALLEAA